MPSKSSLDALLDIRDNAQLAKEWAAEHTRETFEGDQKVFYAVTRCLEIISEASRRLPEELRDRHPEIPWRRMMDAGNVYRHRYDNVAEELVWDTVQEDLDPLLTVIDHEIAGLSGAPGPDISDIAAAIPDVPEPEEDSPDRGLDIEP